MPIYEQPNGDWQCRRKGNYTGYSADVTGSSAGAVSGTGNLGAAPTAVNADLKPGAVLQLCAGSTLRSILKISGAAAGSDVSPNDGEAVGQPIVGMKTPFVIVSEDWAVNNQNAINTLEGVTANLRSGGIVPLNSCQTCKALVKGSVYAGVTLLEPVSGQFYLQPCSRGGDHLVYANVADGAETQLSTSTEGLYDKSYTFPANTLNVGDVIRVRYQVFVTSSNSTDTLTIKLYFGASGITGTALQASSATDAVNSDILTGEAWIIIRTIGTSGTFVAAGTHGKVEAASDTATETFAVATASTAINTTTTNVIGVSAKWSVANSGNVSVLRMLTVEKLSASNMGLGPIAVAMETPSSQPTSTAALVKVKLLTPPT